MNILIRLTFLVSFVLAACNMQAQVTEAIEVGEIRAHVEYLASDALTGRKPGTPGGDSAAIYIRDRFREAGLRLLGEDGLQKFPIVTGISAGERCALSIAELTGELRKTFLPLSFSGEGSLSADVVCSGYGFDFETDSAEWRDYATLDVTGKWVLILRGSPDDDSGDYDPFVSLRKKAMVARDHGAAGVLFVSGPQFDKDDALIELDYQQQESSMDIPVLSIARSIADRLLQGMQVAELEKQLIEQRKPVPIACGGELHAEVQMERHIIQGCNVVGVIEGGDPSRTDEYIVLGAHFDHLGMGGPGSGSRRPDTTAVHNGADDNASGVAAIIEIAEQLAARRQSLQRSVLVIAFDAEEMGLLGSKYFVNNSPVDLTRFILMANLDMVGRMKEGEKSLSIGGTGTAIGLEEAVARVAAERGFTAKMSPEGYGPSDHSSFYSRDIPVLFFFTGVHDDYHTPADDADRLNYPGEKEVADLIAELLVDIAGRDDALVFQEAGPKSRPSASRRFKVTLGIMPDVSSSESRGLRADAVIKGRPADLAGMQKGDVIVAIEGRPVNDIYEYMNRLSDFTPGQRISVEVLRGEEKVVLIVEL
ncbi:MAG: M20/M25/M40 family metallo-hydrolase [Bacteroidetes bacterium]|nr:M20/M25/M40 family metallo-hydrolase [Bacteroidota bacterium]